MSASRTLLRKITKERVTLPDGQIVFADRPPRPLRTKPGTAFRSVRIIRQPTEANPHEKSLHATKGYREVRIRT